MQEFVVEDERYKATYVLDGRYLIIVKEYQDTIGSKEDFLREKSELRRRGKKITLKPDAHEKVEKEKGYRYMYIMGRRVRISED